MLSQLEKLESRLQTLVEGICQIIPNRDPIQQITSSLALAFHSSIHHDLSGGFRASDRYTISMHPNNSLWKISRDDWVPGLIDALSQLAKESEIAFPFRPSFEIEMDGSLLPVQVRVSTHINQVMDESTQPIYEKPEERSTLPHRAFFICPDSTIYTITKKIINIGRGKENHLILDDPTVSKRHAQIRALDGRFMLFDLNSMMGTLINGKRVSQKGILPGDVVTFGNVSLIFGEDVLNTQKTIPEIHQED